MAGKRFQAAVEASGEGARETGAGAGGAAQEGTQAWPEEVVGCLEGVDRRLVAMGEHAISPWWWAQLREFFGSSRWKFVGRVGRRGGKSDTWAKVAIAVILSRVFTIPMGDTGVVSIVSTDREEAAKRIRTISEYLEALDVKHKPTSYAITFPDDSPYARYAIEVKTASVRGVSGFTSILCIGDEVDKWKDSDTGANPAAEVLSSWTPTLATMMPHGAKMALLSSPWLYKGPHSREFDAGTNDEQQAAWAMTWVAHPAMTPEMCRRLEKNPVKFKREYEAIPQPDADDPDLVSYLERATRKAAPVLGRHEPLTYVAAIAYTLPSDRSEDDQRPNAWSLAVTTRRTCEDGRVRTSVVRAQQWLGARDPDAVARELARLCKGYGLRSAMVPDNAPDYITKLTQRHGLALNPTPLTEREHADLRLRLADDGIDLPDDAQLRSDIVDATDLGDVVALGASRALAGPKERTTRPDPYTSEWWDAQERDAAARKRRIEAAEQRHEDGWVQRMAREAGYG
jgi:hypothetical protein